MAQDKIQLPASVVTPLKVEQQHPNIRMVQPRLLNRALGLAPCNTDNSRTMQQIEDPKSNVEEDQSHASPSRRKDRVFRCLSNTTKASPKAPSAAPSQQLALKSMFQPPASKPSNISGICSNSKPMKPSPRRSKEQLRQAQVPSRPSIFSNSTSRSLFSANPTNSSPAENNIGEPVVRKKVQFKPTVAIAWIASHRAYPTKLKRALWGSMKEIKANAIRNTAEYIYDKCNWSKCTEEDQFYRDARSGTLIHPVHVQRYYAAMKKMQEEQAKKRAQQQQEEQAAESTEEEYSSDEEPNRIQEEEEQVRMSRKRLRCCSPSPIRRSHLHCNDYHYDYPEPAPKRYRCSIQPECRSPPYYSPPQYSHYPVQPQQENYYVYYEYDHHHPNPHHPTMQPPYPYQSFPPPPEIA